MKNLAHNGIFCRDFMGGAAFLQKDDFRAEIDGVHDLAAASFHGLVLEGLADAVEEHDADGLVKLADGKGAESRYAH